MMREEFDNKCGCSGLLVTDVESGEQVCSKCGLVAVERAELFAPELSEDKNGAVNKHYAERYRLTTDTVIPNRDTDVYGTQLARPVSAMMARISVYDKRIHDPRNRKARKYLRNLIAACDKLGVNDAFRERAIHMFLEAY